MSIDDSGLDNKITGGKVLIEIKNDHPLIQLAQALAWEQLAEIVLPDLKATTQKGCWWLGRPLRLRIHLGAYLLQQLFNKTDRQTEYDIRDNAVYQLFCGRYLVKKWHCPDHTKLEEFRSRLRPQTQQHLGNAIANLAVKLGFADSTHMDIDSTVQEANMAYPNEANLLCKLGKIAKRVADYLNEKLDVFSIKPMQVNLKGIKSMARGYFFVGKQASSEEKNKRLQRLLDYVINEVKLVMSNSRCMGERFIKASPWNIKPLFYQLINKAEHYIKDVKHFLQTNEIAPNKLLSFHLNEVCCFTKHKADKKYQFGRVFQLARIKGNFLLVGKCDAPNLSDKKAVELILNTHQATFDETSIESASTDKGYYSAKNEKIMVQHGVTEIGIQRPHHIKKSRAKPLPLYREHELINRRAGIEPLIGHAKQKGQLGRSRMKSDKSIEASGYASILGFNLRQMIRYKLGKIQLEAT